VVVSSASPVESTSRFTNSSSDYERWKLLDYTEYQPLTVRPNDEGKITVGTRLRASMSRWFFEDRVEPVEARELESQRH
jgi:ubiquinol-cytochrome c reductase cytochrome b subunit